ncbi:hypothetical protein DBR39_13065 [Chryseobacterium sp. KBW03]|nr:hypothetical protein DBR39_13065 [Chryseobacterium sp. KBW03]
MVKNNILIINKIFFIEIVFRKLKTFRFINQKNASFKTLKPQTYFIKQTILQYKKLPHYQNNKFLERLLLHFTS